MPKLTKPASTHMTTRDEDGELRRKYAAIVKRWRKANGKKWNRTTVQRELVNREYYRDDPAAAELARERAEEQKR